MDRNENVEWRAIPRYEGRYECSEDGDVYSLLTNKVLRKNKDGRGYLQVGLYIDGKQRPSRVHRVIAETFFGKCPDGMNVNHKDGVKTNNHRSNLEYVTPERNREHAIEMGLVDNNGEKSAVNKLMNADIPKIRILLASGDFTLKQIADMYCVSRSAIKSVKSGRTWRCVKVRGVE